MAAPPKPWERPGVNYQSSPSLLDNAMSSGPQISSAGLAGLGTASPLVSSAAPPAPPPRPTTNTSAISRPMYGGYGGYSGMHGGLSSPYGSSMYSPYGGMGGGMGGYGSYGYNRYGMQGDVPGSAFARVAEENSRPAFQSIESIVQAVNSVSMMLDSSFQAVYSSFRAVIGVADNFSRLRSQLVQIFSALALIRTLRYFIKRFLEMLRLRPSGQAEREWSEALAQAAGAVPAGGEGAPKKSAWPILMFFGIVMGGPWLIWKLISSFSSAQEEERWVKGEADHVVAQALYPFSGQGEEELSFNAGQQVILAPKELQPQVRGWLLGSVGGRKGLVPYNYIKVLGKRRGQPSQSTNSTTLPATNPSTQLAVNAPSQSFSSVFNQASSGIGSSGQFTDSVSSAVGGGASAEVPVPDMDTIFGGAQQGESVVPSDGLVSPLNDQNEGELKTAADILDKHTGE